ncbi:hypothetical protein G6732_06345 [Polynucleobacter paneuropaeus]|nr:hypothetical protein [Polynucleobacter paneuropaeus]
MKKLLAVTLVSLAALVGCAYSIADIDVSKSEPSCVRQCSTTYSACVSGGNQIGFKTETLRACQESYKICIQTCPAK